MIWRRKQKGWTIPRRIVGIGWTIVLLVLGLIAGVLTFVGRGLAEDLLDLIGLEDVEHAALDDPALAARGARDDAVDAAGDVGGAEPAARPVPARHAGAATAAGIWLVASGGYGFYVGELSTYNATYGAFAALVILLLWIWLTSMAFLAGCELDAVLVERREARESAEAAISGEPAAASPHRVGAPEPPPREPGRAAARANSCGGSLSNPTLPRRRSSANGNRVPQWIGIARRGRISFSASAAPRGSRWPGPSDGPQPQTGSSAVSRSSASVAISGKTSVSPAK